MLKTSIGIFDSGLGGLSVMKAIRKELPGENLIYFGDCQYAPYGDRSQAFITNRVLAITDFLMNQRIKALVFACNTATMMSIAEVRKRLKIPVIGIEPAIKPAIKESQTGCIGVMATTRTIQSSRFSWLIEQFVQKGSRVIPQACPGLADAVESGQNNEPHTKELIKKYTLPFIENHCDRIVLGCTHYPLLTDQILEVFPPETVKLIDPSDAVARQLKRRIIEIQGLSSNSVGSESFWISGLTDRTKVAVEQLWGTPIVVQNANIFSVLENLPNQVSSNGRSFDSNPF